MDDRLAAIEMPKGDEAYYRKLAQAISIKIKEGCWRAGEALPSERALSEHFGLSRVTVRNALQLLISSHTIESRHGAGNYVCDDSKMPHFDQSLTKLISCTKMLEARGYKSHSVWLERHLVEPPFEVLVKLGLPPGTRVAKLLRQRYADDTVVAVEESYLLVDLVSDPTHVVKSLYAYLESNNNPIVRALQHITAVNADRFLARYADVNLGTALLKVTRTGFISDGRPAEVTITWCRTHYYDFMVELIR